MGAGASIEKNDVQKGLVEIYQKCSGEPCTVEDSKPQVPEQPSGGKKLAAETEEGPVRSSYYGRNLLDDSLIASLPDDAKEEAKKDEAPSGGKKDSLQAGSEAADGAEGFGRKSYYTRNLLDDKVVDEINAKDEAKDESSAKDEAKEESSAKES